MMVAAAAAWLVGFVVTAPMQIADLARDAASEERLLFDSVSHGLSVWAVITLGLAVVAVVLLLGPLATLVPSRWVVGHPWIAAGVLPLLFLMPLGYRMVTWVLTQPGPYDYPGANYADYTVYILVFFAVASMIYLRLLRRGLRVSAD
jgi:hypothetical protein